MYTYSTACPFFFCTREKLPWTEFAESAEHGVTTTLVKAVRVHVHTTSHVRTCMYMYTVFARSDTALG